MTRVDDALAYLRLGWNVLAAPRGGKSPVGQWKRWQTERIPERTVRATFGSGEPNLFIVTGAVSGLVVLDCDDEPAIAYWRERLGDVLDRTACVPTTRGRHFYFRIRPGQVARSRKGTGENGEWDLQAEGKGVVAPPSIHSSGRVYRWLDGRGPEALVDAPDALFDTDPADGDSDTGNQRSMLNHLLSNVPGEGGRNVWLSKVAGHYAKHIPHQDAFETLVREAAAKLTPELPENEIAKMLVSIWGSEQAKAGKAAPEITEEDAWREALAQPAEATGWLVSGGNRILVQVRKKNSDQQWELGLETWMDADLHVLSVVDAESSRTYEVELRRPDDTRVVDVLPATAIADPRRLHSWLANHGVSIGAPDAMYPAKMRENSRLLRYLEAQDVPALKSVPALGWDDEAAAFVTHDGIIRKDGPAGFEMVRPDPGLRNWAPYHYGHGDEQEARAVLRKVLEFHDETVAAVFGAWWAATLLKPQIQRVSSQFPFMALEAASESGKTTGYFSLMMQLAGNRAGQSNPTRAALRDYLSAHQSGIVWVDDLDSLEAHGELLRNVTVGGAIIKKGEGNHEQVVAQMRAALVVSGEGLGLHGQKALLDRAILLEVPSPVGRTNAAGRPQWDDILELKERHPDLSEFAGTIVRLALGREEQIKEMKKLRPGAGRFADKIAVVRLGARLLRSIAGEGAAWVVEATDAWAAAQRDPGAENVLTMKLLPLALARTGWKSRPEGPDPSRRLVATPAFVELEDTVWFSPRLLSDWWEREPPVGRVDVRTESQEALTQQARALGMGGSQGAGGGRKPWRLVTGEGTQVYWRCPPMLSKQLLERSRGMEEGEDGSDQDSLIQ